jgi:ABC-type sulfate/molybdate transport systems ATPase subunit
VEKLELDIATRLRSFELSVGLSVGRESVALVGPSGSGKTTVLRAIAGLHRPDRGRIAIGARTWFDATTGINLAPDRRSVGLVFQDYALFPHLTVRANVAFGGERREDDLLARLRIAELADERPGRLSGGERQRVALARALARDPDVLLLDEPLTALDAHTRGVVRGELQDLLAELALPTLIVTHDFREASALASWIGVLVDGTLRQQGTPDELLRDPSDAFVASFIGANLLTGHATPRAGGGADVRLEAGGTIRSGGSSATGPIGVAVYPWEIRVALFAPVDPQLNAVAGTVSALSSEGGRVRLRVGTLEIECPRVEVERLGVQSGVDAWAVFPVSSVRLVSL